MPALDRRGSASSSSSARERIRNRMRAQPVHGAHETTGRQVVEGTGRNFTEFGQVKWEGRAEKSNDKEQEVEEEEEEVEVETSVLTSGREKKGAETWITRDHH